MDVQCSPEVGLCAMSYINLLCNFKLYTITLFKRQIIVNVK